MEQFLKILDGIHEIDFKEKLKPKLFRDLAATTDKDAKKTLQDTIDKIVVDPEVEAAIVAKEIRSAAKDIGLDLMSTESNDFYLYNGKMWEIIKSKDFQHFIVEAYAKMGVEEYLAKTSGTARRLTSEAEFQLYQSMEDKKKEVKINAQNCTLVLKDGQVNTQEHTPDDYFFYVLPYDYDPEATCERFTKFLDEVIPGDIQIVVQEFLGCCLDTSIKLEKALCCVGTGSNGKSVFFETIMYVLGEDNVTSFNINSLCEDKSSTRILIKDKLLNYSSDFNGKIWSNGIFKQMVSGEPLEAKRLYSDPEIIRHYARIAFNSNSDPDSSDTSAGFRRRLLHVGFNQKITKERQNPKLAEELKSEAPGILNWIILGLQRFIRNGYKLSHSQMLEDKEKEYQEDNDPVCRFLESNGFVPDANAKIKVKDLFSEYRSYCSLNNIKEDISQSDFKGKLRDEGYNISKSGDHKAEEIGIVRVGGETVNPFSYTETNTF